MTTFVWAAVLGAALLHALWNAVVKNAADKVMGSARVALWTGVVATLVALATPAPSAASLPFVIASALIHVVYFLLVGLLYRNADLSVAYPMMRGLAPLVATALAAVALHEVPDPVALVGVLALVGGVAAMGLSGLAERRIDRATLVVALANSLIIAVYSVLDGEGARLAGPDAAHAFAYNAWSDALTAALYLPVVMAMRGRAAVPELFRDPAASAFAGLAAFGGYAIVVWAMTQAPIGAVAALRECSVAFAAIIGVALLGEPFKGTRAGAALLIVGGVVALRLA
ncbi:EamA-like transporter family protein [Roseiarcus fermentans]|uniref:EamA-like transporter family protein n=1 Tax=Roseiarcus fermentans TaxID=1473586 RepID=A0A366FT21_9HYPH|nr:DMT family transporter [Roseiarcus fermentans]RBP17190.1 EamA-like transporter family protein [Roseiarcus fermentans]